MFKFKLNIGDLKTYVYIEIVLAFCIVVTTILQLNTLASCFFAATFIVLIVALFVLLEGNMKRDYFILMVAIIFVSCLCILLSTLIRRAGFTVDSIKQYLIFLTIIIYLCICMHVDVDKKLVDFILRSNLLFAVVYVFGYFYSPGIANEEYVTLNFINPNLTSMWILMTLLLLCIGLFVFKSKLVKMASMALVAMNTYILNLTGSRNCMIALVIFGVLILYSFLYNKKRFGKSAIFFFNILPSFFLLFYLTFLEPIVESGILDFMTSEGKDLASRQYIWTDGVANLSGYWLIGNFPYFKGGNMHNSHFVIATSYGVITLIIVIVYLYKICGHLNFSHRSRMNMICMAAFFAALCTGFGEGVIFSGGTGFFVMVCNLVLLCRYRFNGDKSIQIR